MSRLSFIRFDKSFQMIFAERPYVMAREAMISGLNDPNEVFNQVSAEMKDTVACDIDTQKCDIEVLSAKGEDYGLVCTIREDKRQKCYVVGFILKDSKSGKMSMIGELQDVETTLPLSALMAKHFTMKDFPLEDVYQEICREIDVRISRKMGCEVFAGEGYQLQILSPAIAH